MRKAAGWAVLVIGTAGLGWWARGHDAKEIEAGLSAAAREIATGSVHAVEARVSGRDITLTGTADTQDEQSALIAAMEAIEGRRVVRGDALEVLPAASPYHFEAEKSPDGALASARGVAPTAASIAALDQVVPGAELEMASGAPAGWLSAVSASVKALAPLNSGALRITDQKVEITGEAHSDAELAELEAALSQLPEGFAPHVDLTLVDDGAPASYAMQYDASAGLLVEGRVPAGSSGASFGWALGAASTDDRASEDVAPEAIAAADLEQNNALIAAIAPEMKAIERFALDVTGVVPGADGPGQIAADLRIETRPEADAEALSAAIAANLPEALAGQVQISAAPVGPITASMTTRENQVTGLTEYLIDGRWVGTVAPYLFAARNEGRGAEAVSGHVPSAAAREEISVLIGAEADKLAPAHGAPEGWNAAVIAGVNALEALDKGALEIEGQSLRLTGESASPEGVAAAERALGFLPEGYAAEHDIAVLDDGLPADFSVSYDAAKSARIDGRLPKGMTSFDVADALGLATIEDHSVEDQTEAGAAEAAEKAKAALAELGPWLPQMEMFQLDFEDGAGARGTVALSPGADPELVGAALNDALSDDGLSVDVAASEPLDAEAAVQSRINAATGETERLLGGFWVPLREFEATGETCRAQSAEVLGTFKIGFLSGSARLDAEAARAINALASVVGPCLEAGLIGELGGHTDSSGSAELNQTLSQERADAVRAALIARGLSGEALTAKGYGPSQPIADNETEAGRAKNRRTEIIWSASSADNN